MKWIIGVLVGLLALIGGLFKLRVDSDEKEKQDALKAKDAQLAKANAVAQKYKSLNDQTEAIAKADKEVQVETIDNHDGTVTDKF